MWLIMIEKKMCLQWHILGIVATICFLILSSSRPEVFLTKVFLKMCRKYTGEHPCRNEISIKLLCNFIEIRLQYGCSPVNLLHFFRHLFLRTPRDDCFWVFYKRAVRKNLAIFTGKQACNFIEKRLQHRCFHVNISKFLRTCFRRISANGCFCR